MKAYKPRPGAIAHKVISHLQQLPPGTRITLTQAAEVAGIPTSRVTASLAAALRAGAVQAEIVRGSNEFFLGDQTEAASISSSDNGPLQIARYSADDDLSVKGMQIDGDTAVFTRAQLQQLVDFTTRPHIRPTPTT